MIRTPRDLTTFLRGALCTPAGQPRHGLRVLGDLVRTVGLATLAVWLIVAGGALASFLWVHIWWIAESPDQTLRVVVSVSFGVVVGLVGGWHGHAWWARRRPGPPVRSLDPAGGPPRPAAPGEGHMRAPPRCRSVATASWPARRAILTRADPT